MNDFFISYNRHDKSWAEWIAWQLEAEGYTTFLQAWDFRPSSNFVELMNEGTINSKRTIAVISNNYLQSSFTKPEWTAAFARDPTGRDGLLLPIRIEDCELSGLFGQIIYIDLAGKNKEEAKEILLDGIIQTRSKPSNPPEYPQSDQHLLFPGYSSTRSVKTNIRRKNITNSFILVKVILAVIACILSLRYLPKPIETIWGSQFPIPIFLITFLPILSLLIFDGIPFFRQISNNSRLQNKAIGGKLKDPGYFRIKPYDTKDSDIALYRRADNIHKEILYWILDFNQKIFYITGRSGSGKSSLLNAFVLPQLKLHGTGGIVVNIRSFYNPLLVLEKELNKLRINEEKEDNTIWSLINLICTQLYPKKLILVFDQFEEVILSANHSKQLSPILAITDFFRELQECKEPNFFSLVIMRSDYIGRLQEFEMPALQLNQNWKEVAAFTEPAAKEFLTGSGLVFDDRLIENIVNQAEEVEETRGLVRPITLNMIGLILIRFNDIRNKDFLKKNKLNSLLIRYIKECLKLSEIRHVSRSIVRQLVSKSGSRLQRNIFEIAKTTANDLNVVKGVFLNLSNSGLVRPLDNENYVWEISHDFVARLIQLVLSDWRVGFFKKVLPFFSVLILATWALMGVIIIKNSRAKIIINIVAEISKRNGRIVNSEDGYRISFADADSSFSEILGKLHQLGNINSIDLSKTNVKDEELKYLQNIEGIKGLFLDDTKISDQGLMFLGTNQSITELWVNNTKITNAGLTYLARLLNLKFLKLSNNKLCDDNLSVLGNLINLEKLYLSHNDIGDGNLSFLKKLNKLQTFEADNTKFSDWNLENLAELSNLYNLSLQATNVSDAGIHWLLPLDKITDLDLEGTKITDSAIGELVQLSHLTNLDLSKTNITDNGLILLGVSKSLNQLNIRKTNTNGSFLKGFGQNSPLTELWAKETDFSDSSLATLAQFGKLKVLALPITKISDVGIKHVSELTNLTELYLGGNTALTDKMTIYLLPLKNLKILRIPGCSITDKSIVYLEKLSHLTRLDVSGTKLTDKGLAELSHALPTTEFNE
jgi:Leucine-rich repeat (LRR) protein